MDISQFMYKFALQIYVMLTGQMNKKKTLFPIKLTLFIRNKKVTDAVNTLSRFHKKQIIIAY